MFVATIPNRKSPPAILLRETYREAGRVKSRTLANLSHLPDEAINAIRRILKGQKLVAVDDAFEIVASHHHGHVLAVLTAMKRLGLEKLIASRSSQERDVVVAMLAARILQPSSKLATTRWWQITTLPDLLGVSEATEDDLYAAMDWLLERQPVIEKKLADRHLSQGGLVLYDLSSSYFEGTTCPLAARGYNRDGKKGKLQVNYGLLTDKRGCPVAVSVFEGNTSDAKTLIPQVEKVQQQFNLQTLTLVGDRGMISQKHIDEQLRGREGVDWITALKNTSIQKLIRSQNVQLSLFDEQNLFELTHPDYPDERLIACRNPELAKRRQHKRHSLLEATETALSKARQTIAHGKLRGEDKIRARLNQVVDKTLLNDVTFTITDNDFHFAIKNPQALQKKLFAELCRRLERIRTRVCNGQLKGKSQIHQRVTAVLGKERIDGIMLTVHDEQFSFAITDEARAQQTVLGKLNEKLQAIVKQVTQGHYGGQDKIGLRVGKVIGKYKMEKHFIITITAEDFTFQRHSEAIAAEAALDGLYIIRTSVPTARLTADEVVRTYKSLSQVKRAFRSLKSMDLHVRPIHHRLENRVRAHIFLCLLAYYVEWHMKEAWRPLLFSDEDQTAKATRDPVAPAQRSEAAQSKADTKKLNDGTGVHSFHTLLHEMSSIVRNTCRTKEEQTKPSLFEMTTTPNAKQKRALALLEAIKP